MSASPSIDDRLDSTLDAMMETSTKIMELEVFLEQTLQSGRIALSKARYHNGSSFSVSPLQFDLSAMTAVKRVTSEPLEGGLEVGGGLMGDPEGDEKGKKDEDEKEKSEEAALTWPEAFGLAEPPSPPPRDPLRWFGVLVPQALRAAQRDFQRALPIVCELASQRSLLHHLQQKATQLRARCEAPEEVETLTVALESASL